MTTAGSASTGAARLQAPDRVATPWVDAYPPGVPPIYRWPSVSLGRLLDDAARDFPDAAGVHDTAGTWSWAEVDARATAFAAALVRSGIGPGDRVGLATGRGPLALVVAFATWRVGAVLVPVPRAPRTTRAWVLATAGPRLTVVDADAVADWFHVDHRVVHARPEDLTIGRVRRLRGRRPAPEVGVGPVPTAWRDLVGAADATAPAPTTSVDPAAAAVLLPCRDRAGRRRLATLTHRSLVANVLQTRLWIPDVQAGREVVLCPSPLVTPPGLVGGLLLAALTASALVATDADGAAGVATSAPTLLVADLVDLTDLVVASERVGTDLSSLRAGLLGGGPLSADLERRLLQLSGHARVRRCLGLAEASFLTHANPVYGRADAAHVGLPVTGTMAAVVDPADPTRLVPDGRPGRLVVAGPQVMAGYWQDPEATARVLQGGWLRTELTAVRDATGAFAIVDAVGDTVGEEVPR